MSRKDTTGRRRSPRKAELLAALQTFTQAVRNAGGIAVIEGEPGPRKRDLAGAYRKACKVLNEKPLPLTKESDDDYTDQAARLLTRHSRLVELAENRGYSTKALVGLVMSAAVSENVKALPFR